MAKMNVNQNLQNIRTVKYCLQNVNTFLHENLSIIVFLAVAINHTSKEIKEAVMSAVGFWEVIGRGESGPSYTGKEFDMLVFKTIKELVKKYEIRYEPENLVMEDEKLIENAFRAGVELLVRVGMLNMDSGKVIHVTEDEIFESLHKTPSQVVLGEGKDKIYVNHQLYILHWTFRLTSFGKHHC